MGGGLKGGWEGGEHGGHWEGSAGGTGRDWKHLLYWRAPGRSALALAGTLGTLGCLARFSAVSVGAYGALAVLGVTLPLRLHQVALRALRPSGVSPAIWDWGGPWDWCPRGLGWPRDLGWPLGSLSL
uniref:Reticulon domain-containing protein n=1 Tax=Anas platyrhynchos platyrhynchos TaxID=8840 RepID=A0A493THG1_ANAPP